MYSRVWFSLTGLLILCFPLRATGATIHDAETTAREVSQTLNKPEGRAVDQWLRSQGFTPMTTSESIAGSDGGGDDIQIPYYQADGTRGTLERAVLQGPGCLWGYDLQGRRVRAAGRPCVRLQSRREDCHFNRV